MGGNEAPKKKKPASNRSISGGTPSVTKKMKKVQGSDAASEASGIKSSKKKRKHAPYSRNNLPIDDSSTPEVRKVSTPKSAKRNQHPPPPPPVSAASPSVAKKKHPPASPSVAKKKHPPANPSLSKKIHPPPPVLSASPSRKPLGRSRSADRDKPLVAPVSENGPIRKPPSLRRSRSADKSNPLEKTGCGNGSIRKPPSLRRSRSADRDILLDATASGESPIRKPSSLRRSTSADRDKPLVATVSGDGPIRKPLSLRRSSSADRDDLTSTAKQSTTSTNAAIITTTPTDDDDGNGSSHGQKQPSARGVGRFSSMPASLKPPSARDGFTSNSERGKHTKTNASESIDYRQPASIKSLNMAGEARSVHGRGLGGGGRGVSQRATSMMHMGRPSPRRAGNKSFRTSAGTSMTPPPPDSKRFHDALGISPGPVSNRKTASPRSDSRGGDLPATTHHGTGSILRNSMHGSRHHNANGTLPSHSQRGNVNFGRTKSEDDLEEVEINFEPKGAPLKKSSHHGTNSLDLSGHSFHTVQSILSIDKSPFEDDPAWKKALRYLRILPPHPNEKPEKKRARILTWCVLVLDFVAAMVSITTYNGVQTCCGIPIFSLAADINWNTAFRVLTYVYLLLIFVEIIPVVHRGIPLNIINPVLGFTITFAMFFEDRVGEAVCMWIIEASAILCEFWVYRIKSGVFHKREERLEKCDRNLKECKGKGTSTSNFSLRSFDLDDDDSDDFNDEDSFGGDSFGESDDRSNMRLREARLLRERRILRQTQKADRVQLRYHFGGVILGFSLVIISLILIIFISRAGGLCVKDMKRPIIFELNQLEKCDKCIGVEGECQICTEGSEQCYYPYLKTTSR